MAMHNRQDSRGLVIDGRWLLGVIAVLCSAGAIAIFSSVLQQDGIDVRQDANLAEANRRILALESARDRESLTRENLSGRMTGVEQRLIFISEALVDLKKAVERGN